MCKTTRMYEKEAAPAESSASPRESVGSESAAQLFSVSFERVLFRSRSSPFSASESSSFSHIEKQDNLGQVL